MLLPNFDKAIIPKEKITEYVLNYHHFEGKNKARVFEAVFGLTADDADVLIISIRKGISNHDAVVQSESKYGTKYTVDFEFSFNFKTAMVRTGWLIETGTDIPRLITCYVNL